MRIFQKADRAILQIQRQVLPQKQAYEFHFVGVIHHYVLMLIVQANGKCLYTRGTFLQAELFGK